MFQEFKTFILRGNVMDMAIGIIIGAAFGAIVGSLVGDVIMPPIGMLMSGVNFNDLFWTLDGKAYPSLADATKAGAPIIAYGKFLMTIINFLIISFVIFMIVKQINRLQKPAPAPAPPPMKDCPMCTTSIPAAARRCPACTSELAKAAGA